MTAPRPNKPSIVKSGSSPAVAARAMLHVHGQYKSNHPEKRQRYSLYTDIFEDTKKKNTNYQPVGLENRMSSK